MPRIKIKRKIKRNNEMYKENKKKNIHFIFNTIVLILVAISAVFIMTNNKEYLCGQDIYGHIYKSNILYDSLKEGDLFLKYDPSWYNGIQPFRYWAPLSYYVIAGANLILKDIYASYSAFLLITYLLAGMGILAIGRYVDRQKLALFLAVIWFFIPNNFRVLFEEGNLPFVMAISFVPLIFFVYYKSLKENKIYNYLILSVMMSLVVLSHAMIAAMVGIAIFLYSLFYGLYNKKLRKTSILTAYALLGVLLAGFWLYPGLKGGIVGGDPSLAEAIMKMLTYPLSETLNPMLRFDNSGVYYFGLSFVIIAILGILFADKNVKVGLWIAVLTLVGTSKFTLPLLLILPFNQLFWMTRFTSIGLFLIFLSLMLWKNLRKSLLVLFCLLIIIDSLISVKVLKFSNGSNDEINRIVEEATETAQNRVAFIDASEHLSMPSYSITYGKNSKKQVYGWAWQGATTGKNIVQLNTALEESYFGLMFDRSLELGADTVVVKKSITKDLTDIDEWAEKSHYKRVKEDEFNITYCLDVKGEYGTVVSYEGISIGKYASNIEYLFPSFITGDSIYIDDYSLGDFDKYSSVALTGFKYKDKKKAEELIKALGKKGKSVFVDTAGMENTEFMGSQINNITINEKFEKIYFEGKELEFKKFPEGMEDFRTSYATYNSNSDNKDFLVAANKKIYYKEEVFENVILGGLNLPYYTFITKDESGIKLLEHMLKQKAFELPKREIVPMDIEYIGDDYINIKSSREGAISPLAAIDGFTAIEGSFDIQNNLVKLEGSELKLKIGVPYLEKGLIISVISLILICILSQFIRIMRKRGEFDG